MKFRKKPVVIDAWPVRELLHSVMCDWESLPKDIVAPYEQGGWVFTSDGIHIPTLEGTMLASPDDWIIKGVKGEFYPCKPDIFAATYEAVAARMTHRG